MLSLIKLRILDYELNDTEYSIWSLKTLYKVYNCEGQWKATSHLAIATGYHGLQRGPRPTSPHEDLGHR
jgi:hypothetical protein